MVEWKQTLFVPEPFPPALLLLDRLLLFEHRFIAQAQKAAGAGGSGTGRDSCHRGLNFRFGQPRAAEDRNPNVVSSGGKQRYYGSRFGQGVFERAAAKGLNPVSPRYL